MFTGLIETLGKVKSLTPRGGGAEIGIDISGLDKCPETGASIAVNGACLTVTSIKSSEVAIFDAVSETLMRTTLGSLRTDDKVNLESALCLGDPLDGHIVQGHVDGVGTLAEITRLPESCILRFAMPPALAPLVAEKGSIAVAGVSLTVVEAGREWFSVSIIPETLKRTTLATMQPGSKVNLEADVLARYIARQRSMGVPESGGLSEEMLRNF